MKIIPVSFKQAASFVTAFHRHNKRPTGCKFCLGVTVDDLLVGVAVCGRPVARMLDDGLTCEITRTCTDGTKNANSCLYGACRRVAKAMGYLKVITYTQLDESGDSLRAAGFVKTAELPARKSWAESTVGDMKKKRSTKFGGVPRCRWEINFQ